MALLRRESEIAPYGLAPVAVLTAVNLVDKIESNLVAGVLPLLQQEWRFSDTFAGSIPTAAALASLIFTLPGGYLADRFHRGRLLALIVASWSALSVLSAMAVSFSTFFATRVVLGAADSLDNPSASSLLADCYGPKARGRVFGLQRIALAVGTGLGAVIGGTVGETFGWRVAFLVAALPGLMVAAACAALPEPPRGAMDRYAAMRARGGDREPLRRQLERAADSRAAGSGLRVFFTDLLATLRIPTVRFVYTGASVALAGLGGLGFWLPTFLERSHGIGEGAAGSITAGVMIVGALGGAAVGGILGDRWHGTRAGGRVALMTIGLAGAGLGLGAAVMVAPLFWQTLVFVGASFLFGLAIPNFAAVTADVLPAAQRGAGFSLFQLLATASGALGPLAVGAISDSTGSLRAAFLSLLPLTLVGAALLGGARRHVDADTERAASLALV